MLWVPIGSLVSRGRCGREIAWLWRLAAVVAASSCHFEDGPKNLWRQAIFLHPAKRKPCDVCSGMVASPLGATVVTAICDVIFVLLRLAEGGAAVRISTEKGGGGESQKMGL